MKPLIIDKKIILKFFFQQSSDPQLPALPSFPVVACPCYLSEYWHAGVEEPLGLVYIH